ncbi:MAG: hypothetical protein IJT79_06045 [Ruminococcus sp.]|nr:hypothetical protein [Ruminococcus sp.]
MFYVIFNKEYCGKLCGEC